VELVSNQAVILPNTFLNLAGNQSAGLLDQNFNALANSLNTLTTYANYFVDGGTVNAISVTTPAGIGASYNAGLRLQIKLGATNTGPVTINVNGLGGKPLYAMISGALQSPPSGTLVAGQILDVIYDGTQFQLNSASTSAGNNIQSLFAATASSTTFTTASSAVIPNLGWLKVEAMFTVSGITTGTQGMALNLFFTGAQQTVRPYNGILTGFVNGGAVGPVAFQFQASATAAPSYTLGTISTSVGLDWVHFTGIIYQKSSTPGTLGLAFAQAVASPNPVQISAPGYLIVTPLN